MLCFFGSTSLNHAALLWEYSSTDGTSTLSGTFETDRTYQDSQAGLVAFNLTEFKTIVVDGTDVTESLAVIPSGSGAFGQFEWNRDDKKIERLLGSAALVAVLQGSRPDGTGSSTIIQLSFPLLANFQFNSILTDKSNFIADFLPTETTITPLTPVPEAEEYAAVMLLSVSAFVLWRRRQRGQQIYSTKQDHVVLPPC
jgi:hypothetical protein